MITIESIQVGKVVTEGDPDTRDVLSRQWTSAFRKSRVDAVVSANELGIVGDQVADTKNHGGPDKAILCYASVHYRAWAKEHPELELTPGGFGENLTLAGATESDVCIGDRFQSGDCVLEISQPRQPCWKIARRWQTKSMTKEVAQTGRTGWYVRVVSDGQLAPGATMALQLRPNPEWTVARANDVLYGREVDRMSVHALMNLPQLSREWQDALA
ncbi:6-N-hydroxylaminopurine resistance protein [Stieleria maiorica]|uniref:6-N-hydroxylaminopurine resistance protein n=1 Tax=Stieleria maiorica TaxID=2795974 RepID=A0A5B9MI71_9BACT|nr:MOSC domain-containing protein [Stieleria maiorica]QEG00849.1 6-N-hydroxylaminopurine resistance protein [Stieleria maiorica]